jgi:hypothetical protein
MRDIPTEMVARIESGAATLCHAWLLTLRDGARMGFTDHDHDLEVEGVSCRAGSGWTTGAMESGADRVGMVSVAGGLDDDAINAGDLEAGLYDGVAVELWKLDWARPDLAVRLWRGRVVRVCREGDGFTGELEGPLAALDRVIGRTFGRDCDADPGDSRCGVDPAIFAGRGCDRRWGTCVGTFGNGANFRGFPDIPGDDFLTASPVEGGRNDGGSRR